MSETVRVRLRVTGRVQGVGFRWFVREEARRLGLAGWVRNAPDGSVELELHGSVADIEHVRHAVARGPSGAAVVGVEEQVPGMDELPHPFKVHH